MQRGTEPADQQTRPDAFRAVVESAPDGIVISRNAIVIYANPAAAVLLGYENASDMVGLAMSAFLDQAALTTMGLRLQRMRETGEKLVPREYPAIRRDGSTVICEISSIFVTYEGAPAVLAFARDVTERTRLRAQLAHADRLASLGMMAAGIAHEINNPLAFVMLAADMLERESAVADGRSAHELVHNIQSGVRRIASIVRDLRTYGQYEEETPTAVDLAAVIESAASITAHEVRPRARLRREHEALPAVLSISMRLEQVFVNLLLNAAHAIDEGRSDGEIAISAQPREQDVVVEVTDNGNGIPADLLPRIFEPFVTTRPNGEGVGLGLSICRDIVARWGGRIEAESEVGRGTTLRVTLPMASETTAANIMAALVGQSSVESVPPLETSGEPDSHVRSIGARRRVLVIDDEPLTVAMASAALRDVHDVFCETDPAAGLNRILGEPSFDVVVCDLMMPGMTGMDIYESVARQRPGLEDRFIFLTGGPYTQRARAFLETVPNRKLMKPLSVKTLLALVSA